MSVGYRRIVARRLGGPDVPEVARAACRSRGRARCGRASGWRGRRHVLVVGTSDAVGRPPVQLARHRGPTVIGTASASRQDLVREPGAIPADHAVPDLAGAIRAAAGPVAVAFDALADGGTLGAYGFRDVLGSDAPRGEAAGATPPHERSARARTDGRHRPGLIAAGTLMPLPAETLPLDAAGAHRRDGAGTLRHRPVPTPSA